MSAPPPEQSTDTSPHASMGNAAGSLWRLLFWPCLLLFVLISLLGLVHWYFKLDLNGFSLAIFDRSFMALAALFHALALALSIGSWHVNLNKHRMPQLSLLQSVAMTGLSTLGKYTPGKVWGLLARGAAVQRLSGKTQTAATSALTEQIALLHSGGSLAVICMLAAMDKSSSMMAPVLLLILISVPLLARSGTMLWPVLQRIDRAGRLQGMNPDQDFKEAYPLVFAGLLLMWLAASAVLWAAVRAYGTAKLPGFADLTLITLFAYFAGFASFFAPAGLGVRDGIMTAMLTPYTGVGPALYISLLHRLITAGFDLLLGILSLFLVEKKPPQHED